ncbi:MAG: HD domain-containing protein, partial [Prolixibacteraceae bacterium]
KNYFTDEFTGHDWWHIYRVRNLALKIADEEGGNLYVIEMAALLHDMDDWKLEKKAEDPDASELMRRMKVPENKILKINKIVNQVSFKGAGVETKAAGLEAKIVQDADRLDAMGAIGIARAFAYGGSKNRLIYHPEIKPAFHANFESYKKGIGPTVNHFYEKLLLLKDRLNTKTAKKIAEKRHWFMEEYLNQFFNEWENYS